MDHLALELVGLVLCHVDHLSLPVCRAVCRKWSDALAAQCLPEGASDGDGDDKGTTATLADAAAEVVAEEEDGEENYWNYAGRLAAHGRLTVLQWARAQGCPVDEIEHARGHAARTGHLPVLQWLYDIVDNEDHDDEDEDDDDDGDGDGDGDGDDDATVEQAAKGGHVAVLEWLRDRPAGGGSMVTRQWLRLGRARVLCRGPRRPPRTAAVAAL
ncbi:uncharacterized protein ACA1_031380 [Acanthamoeba castellanii str. Neff]|uniref:F-box domain-containing protein n=1 Tax=Acanthamoeba castellanii (strain ATCC 30010 / Neff) TaxID=1257118 RepID=L8GGM7_ACACF|nr:uncharacterized protein ACA1_031380 [Acanthamoeba castellanii str. Neff]ELR12235.1 hypothetical protein ACA1_031380 [Acanthamoeba castellanii str. Neff]